MSIDKTMMFTQPGAGEAFAPAERLEGVKKGLWEKARKILSRLGIDLSSAYGEEKGEEIVDRIEEIEQMAKGEEYDDGDDHLFIETDIDYHGRPAMFKMVAQADPDYDPAYEIDYAREMPDFQKEAERRLMREAVIGEKFGRFGGAAVTADTIEDSATTPGQDMYFVKSVKESSKETDRFGREEGRRLADTLIRLQYDVRASEMIKEIMAERGYGDQYRLENEFSEDIFNDFDGYMDNSDDILKDRVADKAIKKSQIKPIKNEMEKYRALVESRQMKDGEYSLVHNNAYLDNLMVGHGGEVRLSDWSNVGTTQNRELSLVNDIGQALESARENLEEEQALEFERGLAEGLEESYVQTEGEELGRQLAEAVMRLVKLRMFQEK